MSDFFRNLMTVISIFAIPLVLLAFLGWGLIKKVKVYEVFVEGAKEGFGVAIRIIPYLVAMLAAIGIFRASGALDLLIAVLTPATNLIGMPPETLPMALMRPFGKRLPRDHDGADEGSWSGFPDRHHGLHHVRLVRNDVLRAGGLFRFGEREKHAACSPDRPYCGCGGDAGCRVDREFDVLIEFGYIFDSAHHS